MLEACNFNMVTFFEAGWATCLDESTPFWTNIYTSPGFVWINCKPWLYRNKYQIIFCCISGILFGLEIVEGKDHPKERPKELLQFKGSTIGYCFISARDSST